MHSAHHWDKDGENRRPFAERNDGRSPAIHFTWFLAVLALRLSLEGVTNPPESTESGSSCETLSVIFYCLYNDQKPRYDLCLRSRSRIIFVDFWVEF